MAIVMELLIVMELAFLSLRNSPTIFYLLQTTVILIGSYLAELMVKLSKARFPVSMPLLKIKTKTYSIDPWTLY